MQKRPLPHIAAINPIGFGAMNLDHAYGAPTSAEQGERVLLGALDAGYDFFDTATLYGAGKNEERVGSVLKAHRSKLTLASKCGMGIVPVEAAGGKLMRVIDGRPETLKREIDNSLKRLQTDVIDLYYLHRWDKKVPIEDSVGAMSRMVEAGKIRAIGLSEVGAATIRKAHAVHPITAIQTEYSLWTRNPEIAVLQTCKELGIAFVAFSPVARGFLADTPLDTAQFVDKDIRKAMARFQGEAYVQNLGLLAKLKALAQEHGATVSQLALAWVLAQGEHIITIPGTTSTAHMLENMATREVPADVIKRAGEIMNQHTVAGPRYDAQATIEVDTENF
jgi:aryl-alcohol dehydrogenase-like predicted oxidoreductase